MKLLDIFGSAASNMMRSKVRTALTIVAIFIGSLTIALTLGISSGVSSYIDKQVGAIGAEDVLIIQPKIDMDTSDGPKEYDPTSKAVSSQQAFASSMLDADDVEQIKSQDGLSGIRPLLLVNPEYIEGANEKKYQLSIQPAIESTRFEFIAGTMPDNSDTRQEILITEDYVDVLGYGSAQEAVGKTAVIGIKTPLGREESVEAVISGVQQQSILSQGGLTANNQLVDTLYEIQTEGLPVEATERYRGVLARFDTSKGPEELARIKNELDKKGYRGVTVEDQIGIVKNVIDAITAVLVFFGAIALLAASFGIINTLYMSVQERTKEIGLMKAMGMSQAKVFMLFSVEAILIGFWGSFLGAVAAIGAGQVVNKIAAENFLSDLPGFQLTVFPVAEVVGVILIIMLIAFLAGTLPARRAAKQDPITALRYE